MFLARPLLLSPAPDSQDPLILHSLPRSFAPERSASPSSSTTSALFACLPGMASRAFSQSYSFQLTRLESAVTKNVPVSSLESELTESALVTALESALTKKSEEDSHRSAEFRASNFAFPSIPRRMLVLPALSFEGRSRPLRRRIPFRPLPIFGQSRSGADGRKNGGIGRHHSSLTNEGSYAKSVWYPGCPKTSGAPRKHRAHAHQHRRL